MNSGVLAEQEPRPTPHERWGKEKVQIEQALQQKNGGGTEPPPPFWQRLTLRQGCPRSGWHSTCHEPAARKPHYLTVASVPMGSQGRRLAGSVSHAARSSAVSSDLGTAIWYTNSSNQASSMM